MDGFVVTSRPTEHPAERPAAGDHDGGVTTLADPDVGAVRAALQAREPFWLDLFDPGDDVIEVLARDFAFHPLAVEDAEHFGQRPKIDTYDDFVLVVGYGLDDDGEPVEVHFFVGGHFLVTVHRAPSPAIDAALAALRHQADALAGPVVLLYHVLDALVDRYFPHLDALDDAIDALQDDILRRPTDAQLGTLFDLKRRLITIRRLSSEQRDMVASVVSGTRTLPGLTADTERYFRDVYDHLARISQTADGYRDLLSSALDTYLSTTSNRLNVVMKQLAIIATVFLPLSFVTGFFGQNFGWLVAGIGGPAVFWTAGVGLQVAIAGGLLLMFRRMGWLGGSPP